MKKLTGLALVMIALCISFTLSSCKKDTQGLPPVRWLSYTPKALEYVLLPEQHYRIYKDSATGVHDSVVIAQSRLDTGYSMESYASGSYVPGCYYQKYYMELRNLSGPVSEWLLLESSLIVESPYHPTSGIMPMDVSVSPLAYGGEIVFHLSDQDEPGLSLTVEGILYSNVVRTDVQPTVDINDPFYKKFTYWWAKGIGIIKRSETRTGGAIKTWTFVRGN